MTKEQIEAAFEVVSNETIDFHARLSTKIPKQVVLTGMIGACAAIAMADNISRDNVIAMINSCFDDMEGANT